MEAEVEVAEPEPVLPAPAAHRFERLPGLAGPAPAALRVVETGEGVEDRVEVGGDVQAEHLEVVADVADDGQLPGREHVVEAGRELGAADAAGEEDDVHAGRLACSRSATVSTSSRRPASSEVVDGEPEGYRVRPEPGGAAGAVERREHGGRREAERVRGAVGGRHDGERTCLRRGGERLQVGGLHARQIGVDDETDALHRSEPGLDGSTLAATRVGHDLDTELIRDRDGRGVVGDEQHAVGRAATAAASTSRSIASATSTRSSAGSRSCRRSGRERRSWPRPEPTYACGSRARTTG